MNGYTAVGSKVTPTNFSSIFMMHIRIMEIVQMMILLHLKRGLYNCVNDVCTMVSMTKNRNKKFTKEQFIATC